MMWVDFTIVHFWCDTLLRLGFLTKNMVRTLRRSPLDTNLTKWLSKCEGSVEPSGVQALKNPNPLKDVEG